MAGLEIRQQLKLTQTLTMTPQLQQAIKLLQLSRMELVEMVQQELVENPVLEEAAEAEEGGEEDRAGGEEEPRPTDMALEGVDSERAQQQAQEVADAAATKEVSSDERAVNEIDWDAYLEDHATAPPLPRGPRPSDDDLPSLEATLTAKPSLEDHLLWQLTLSGLDEREMALGRLIIGNIDPRGYFAEPPLEDLVYSAGDDLPPEERARRVEMPLEQAERVLARIQTFDPIGVAARNLEECLLIQARHAGQDDEIVVRIIRDHLKNLETKSYQAIARDLGQPLDEIIEAVKVISSFDPRPGRLYGDDEPIYITPDVYVHKLGDEYFVVPNDDGLPKLKISGFYRAAMRQGGDARSYIRDKLRSAQWLIRSIQQRQRTIIRVTESIVRFQRDFFDKGIDHLKPLILRDVADDIGMHESTVSRVTTNKYVHTPRGIFELKYFFNSAITRGHGEDIASQSVKNKIKAIIAKEDPKKPYSDQKIVELLRKDDIEIARRTVAKYREQMGILSSSKRRKVF